MTNISQEQKMLLSLLGHSLFATPLEVSYDIDWVKVYLEGRAQAVVSTISKGHATWNVSPDAAERIKKEIKQYTLNNIVCLKQHAYLHQLMTEHGIPYCVIKGAASAHYYPDPLMRNMGDVDFYISPNDVDKALAVLLEAGFERKEINHPYHIVLQKGNAHFELHFKPIGAYEGRVGEMVEADWQGICDDAVMVDDGFSSCRIPSLFHHGIVLLTHLQSHLVSEGVGLRHLCDWAVFVNALSEQAFVDIFETKLKAIGLWKLAQVLSLLAVDYLGMPYRAWMGEDHDTAHALLLDILYGGNFGRKDTQRSYEGIFIADKKKRKSSKNRIAHMFVSLNRIVDVHWKIAKKCPVIYPFGWIFFSLRFLFRVMTGKRHINFADTYQKSGQRKALYDSLKIFEPEV